MGERVRQADVQKAVAGAIKGGLPPGSFRVEVDAARGRVLIQPINGNEAPADENELDAEIRNFINGKG